MCFEIQTSKFRGFATFWGFNSIIHFLLLAQKKPNHVPTLVPKYGWQERKGTTNKSSPAFAVADTRRQLSLNASTSTVGHLPFMPQTSHTVCGQPTQKCRFE